MTPDHLAESAELHALLSGDVLVLSVAPLDRLISRVRGMTAATWQTDRAAILAALERLRPPDPDPGELAAQRAQRLAEDGFSGATARLVRSLGYMPPGARAWAELVVEVVHEAPAATTAGVLTMLGEPVDRQAQAQVGRILRALGWRRERVRSGVRRTYRYLPPSYP